MAAMEPADKSEPRAIPAWEAATLAAVEAKVARAVAHPGAPADPEVGEGRASLSMTEATEALAQDLAPQRVARAEWAEDSSLVRPPVEIPAILASPDLTGPRVQVRRSGSRPTASRVPLACPAMAAAAVVVVADTLPIPTHLVAAAAGAAAPGVKVAKADRVARAADPRSRSLTPTCPVLRPSTVSIA